MECGMLSLQDIAAVKTAIVICNDTQLKRNILFESEFVSRKRNIYDCNKLWDKKVEKKAMATLKIQVLPKKLQKIVMNNVPAIGLMMLNWAEYHERALGICRECSSDFLNSSFFTHRGFIDNKKVAEELLKDKNLSIEQKYKLACLYCFEDHIPALYTQMTKEDKEMLYSTKWGKQPALVIFWSYYLIGAVDIIKGENSTLDEFRLEKAVESGSKAAVEYCLQKTSLRTENHVIVDAAVEAVRNCIIARNDRTNFRNKCYLDYTWVPNDYYVDIVSFLLSKMREDQQIEFLKKDIEGAKYQREYNEDHRRSRVLEYFLNWPYQDYFMKTVGLMWEFLPVRNYAVLLLKICEKIEPKKDTFLQYSQERSYDYRELLKEFWYQSPERYKSYVLSNQKVVFRTDKVFSVKAGTGLVIKLLTLKKFTYEDGQNIGMILASATDEEKENILSSNQWRKICIELIKKEKWEILDRFELNCVLSNHANEFKRKLISSEKAKCICIDFVRNDKWDAVDSVIKWSSLSEEEVSKLKKEMIYSGNGKRACRDLFLHKEGVELTDKFCKWCFSSEKEAIKFKKELIFSDILVNCCACLILKGKLELFDKFISWCLFSQGVFFLEEFKKSFAYRKGDFICVNLISAYSAGYSYKQKSHGYTVEFKGGKWEEVEKFLTWCFSSEEEIIDFKKYLFVGSGKEIHFSLIKSSQWEEAKTFFAWLGLSAEEIKNLKKETLFHHPEASKMFSKLMHWKKVGEYADYGSTTEEAIELLLRWFLTDKETVLEVKGKFKYLVRDKDDLKNFDLMIEQHLKDLNKEQMGVKRKSETFSPNKKFNVKRENRGTEYGK